MAQAPTIPTFRTELRDGTPVLVGPVAKEHRQLLELGLEHLSAQSRYFRFFRPVARLSEETLDTFSSVDQIDHIAIGALDLTHEDPYPVGVARSIRLSDQYDKAEIAVAVIDTHHDRGLGTILLAAVAHAAAARGVKAFVASVLRDNRAMLDLFAELDAEHHAGEAGVVELVIPIHTNPALYPATPTGASFGRVYALLDRFEAAPASTRAG